MKTNKGFTLIELLVVIAIIGLISTIAMISISGARAKARVARRLSDLDSIRTALEMYYTENNAYPSTANNWRIDCMPNRQFFDNYIPDLAPKYVGILPHDPKTKCSGGNGDYYYAYRSNGQNYKFLAPIVPNVFNAMERCGDGAARGVIDPQRPCNAGDQAWAVYTDGAHDW